MIEEEAVIHGRRAQSAQPMREGEENEEGAADKKNNLKKGTATANLTIPEKVVTEIAIYAQ